MALQSKIFSKAMLLQHFHGMPWPRARVSDTSYGFKVKVLSFFLNILFSFLFVRYSSPVHTAPEKFENTTVTGHFECVFEQNSDRKSETQSQCF